MSFCTKCGQEIVDGEVHICPAARKPESNQSKPKWEQKKPVWERKPGAYGAGRSKNADPSFRVNRDGEKLDISIDKDQLKQRYNNLVDKIAPESGLPEETDNSIFERGKRIVPDCICANDGEIPVKQYNVAKLRTRLTFSKAEGRLQITNKRVIFRAAGRSILGKTVLHQEFEIGEIAGLESRDNPHFNLLNAFGGILLSIIFGALGTGLVYLILENSSSAGIKVGFVFAAIFAVLVTAAWIFLAVLLRKRRAINRHYALRHMVLAFAVGLIGGHLLDTYYIHPVFIGIFGVPLVVCLIINWVMLSIVPSLIILLKTKGSFPGLQIEKAGARGLFLGRMDHDNTGFAEVLPWGDTSKAIREAGAIIDDIQTMGDAAIAKWAEK